MDETEVLIVGAGLAGLSCARTLRAAGLKVRVLDRSHRVGGRCASKRLEPGTSASPFDFGPVFVHGDDADFLGWLEASGVDLVPGWPRVVEGTGTPCQPQAFDPLQRRYAVPGGMRRLAEALGAGVDVAGHVTVERLEWDTDHLVAVSTEGRRERGRHLVLALALEQSRDLLSTLSGPSLAGALALLRQFSSLPCLSLLVGYEGVPPPPWDLLYPASSRAVLLVSNETSKRSLGRGAGPSLVLQARPGWSAARLDRDPQVWARELLAEASDLVGPWVNQPQTLLPHRWEYARLAPSDHLTRPLLLEQPGSVGRLGVTGDLFDPEGGLQGAWKAGRALAHRILEICPSP